MIDLLDYILDFNDNFWIVNCIDNCFKGYMVYQVDDNGEKYNHITHKYYKKYIQKSIDEIVPPFKMVFKARRFYKEHKKDLTGVWKDYVETLNKVGISDDNIGIFGSYLIGFEIKKDVDFVIYGKDNLQKYYEHIDFIRKSIHATKITEKHILHQYNKHKDNYPKKTDLKEIISRNWSGVQIKDGVLSTPRFVDLSNQISPFMNTKKEKVVCEVLDGFESVMLPRKAKVLFENEEYTLVTNLWKYQSFAKKGDIIETLGHVDRERKTIFLADYDSYIKYLKKSSI